MGFTVDVSLFIAGLAGVFSFLSPCVLPLVPSFLSYLTGVSFEELGERGGLGRRAVVAHTVLFVGGFSSVFILLGASASAAGRLLSQYQPLLVKASGLVILFFGLLIMGIVPLSFLARERRLFSLPARPAGFAGAFLVGVAFGVGWTPCIGPVLGAILTLAATAEGVNRGVVLLATYSLGMGVPFLLSALLFRSFLGFFQRYRRFLQAVHVGGGAVLAGVGVLLLSGYFQYLNAYAALLTPRWLVKLL